MDVARGRRKRREYIAVARVIRTLVKVGFGSFGGFGGRGGKTLSSECFLDSGFDITAVSKWDRQSDRPAFSSNFPHRQFALAPDILPVRPL